uniref:Uncharacterized protein n=1 Tax=Arundo donax TaxID=35708 RepID=A0A0A9CQ79_ARUDO
MHMRVSISPHRGLHRPLWHHNPCHILRPQAHEHRHRLRRSPSMPLIAILIHHGIRVGVRQCLQAHAAVIKSCPISWLRLIHTLHGISMIVHEHRR